MEGFSTDKKVAIISNQSVPVYFSERNDFPDIQYDRGLRKQFIGFCEPEGKEAYASTKICALIKNMLGVTMRPASQDQIDTIMDSEEYSEMGVWPSEDSVRIIDDIIVVNFL